MSTSQCAPDPGLGEAQFSAPPGVAKSRLLKGMLIGFAASMTIGFALTSWYVGGRIVAAKESAAPKVVAGGSKPVAPPANLYLEVAGLGPKRDQSFVKRMEARGYSARIENAPIQADRRILIGPFVGRSAMQLAQRRLESDGLLATEVTH